MGSPFKFSNKAVEVTNLGVPDQWRHGARRGLGLLLVAAINSGTWADNAGGTLPSGTYGSGQTDVALEGCPLNGTWTIEICDSWGVR